MRRSLTLLFVITHTMIVGQNQQTVNIHAHAAVGEKLLTDGTWMTCAFIDSLHKFQDVQLIRKSIIDTLGNCTSDGCASSDWDFKIDDDERICTITSWSGCQYGVIRTSSYKKWTWTYDPIKQVINLYSNEGKEEYHLLVKKITKNQLYLIVFKTVNNSKK